MRLGRRPHFGLVAFAVLAALSSFGQSPATAPATARKPAPTPADLAAIEKAMMARRSAASPPATEPALNESEKLWKELAEKHRKESLDKLDTLIRSTVPGSFRDQYQAERDELAAKPWQKIRWGWRDGLETGFIQAVKVIQVVDDNNLLVQIRAKTVQGDYAVVTTADEMIWISGIDTKGMIDGRVYDFFDNALQNMGTKRYQSAAGTRTVRHLEVLKLPPE